MDKNRLQQLGLSLMVYLSVCFIVFAVPTSISFVNVVGLSYELWLPFTVLFVLGVLFVLIQLRMEKYRKPIATLIAGLVVGIIANIPLVLLIAKELYQGRATLTASGSGEAFAVVVFSVPIMMISLFGSVALGFLQYGIMSLYGRSRRRKGFIAGIFAFFLVTGLLLGQAVRSYHRNLLIGCPDFRLTVDSVALSSEGCLSQASVKSQKGVVVHKVPEFGLQFEYPKYWGKPNFYERNGGVSGKNFSMPFGEYYSLDELVREGLVVGGATTDFQEFGGQVESRVSSYNEETCTFVRRSFNKDVAVSLTGNIGANVCAGVEHITAPFGTIYFYHAPLLYKPVTESYIRPNDGVAVVPLQTQLYKVMFIKKLLYTPEKEAEFRKFLQSFEKLVQ